MIYIKSGYKKSTKNKYYNLTVNYFRTISYTRLLRTIKKWHNHYNQKRTNNVYRPTFKIRNKLYENQNIQYHRVVGKNSITTINKPINKSFLLNNFTSITKWYENQNIQYHRVVGNQHNLSSSKPITKSFSS